MKILQVIPVFSIRFGGPVAVVRSISKELAKNHEVDVYTTNALDHKHNLRDSPFEVKSDGYRVTYFPRVLRFIGVNASPAMAKTMRETIKEYDVIHLHSWRHFQDIVVHHYARKYGIPYVLQAHGSLSRIVARQWSKWVYDVSFGWRVLRDSSKVISLNQVEAKEYKAWGVPEANIEIVPNGIDLTQYVDPPSKGYFRKRNGIEDHERIVLYLGRIHRSKGLNLLAKAFAIVSKHLCNARLVVIGPDDGYLTAFDQLTTTLGIREKVTLKGFVDKKDKLAALVDSDVFVTPRFYGFPITFLEACSASCPIVTATKSLDWIDGNVGYIVEPSSTSLAKAISRIIVDADVKRRFESNCQRTILSFDVSKIASRLEDVYSSAQLNGADVAN